jgi:nitrous oxide reductase
MRGESMMDGDMDRRRFLGRLAMMAIAMAAASAGAVLPAASATQPKAELPIGRTSLRKASHYRELAG